MKKNNISNSPREDNETSNKYLQSIKDERDILKKQNAIFHNAFMEINLSLCRNLSSEQRLQDIINKVQSTRINVSKIVPNSTIVLL